MTSIEELIAGFEGAYEVREAARYLYTDIRPLQVRYRIRYSHLLRWIRLGLALPGLAQIPGRQLLIGFEDLISMRVIAFLRARGYSFAKIRKAEAELRKVTEHSRPFATERIWVEKKGAIDIFAEIAFTLLTATRGGQLAFIEFVRENLIDVHGLTFDERGIAASWSPRSGVLLHPQIQFGRPCIAGTRIPTGDIDGMVRVGDSIEFLAASYRIVPEQIENAIAWEEELAAV